MGASKAVSRLSFVSSFAASSIVEIVNAEDPPAHTETSHRATKNSSISPNFRKKDKKAPTNRRN